MNPFEEIDPEDRTSYANASLSGRITTIFAGPLGNYLFASVLFFAVFAIGGEPVPTMEVDVIKGGAAQAAGLRDGDTIVSVDGAAVTSWDQMRRLIVTRANRPGEDRRLSPGPAAHLRGGAEGRREERERPNRREQS